MWILYAKRPLTAEELLQALAVRPDAPYFNRDYMSSLQTITDACLGLIVLDEQRSTVHFYHLALTEYSHNSENSKDLFRDAEYKIAEACVACLSYRFSEKFSADEDLAERFRTFPFLSYATHHWGTHVRQIQRRLATQCLRFLSRKENASIAYQALNQDFSIPDVIDDYHPDRGFGTGDLPSHDNGTDGKVAQNNPDIHLAIRFRLLSYISELIKGGSGDADRDIYGRTSLSWAAEYDLKDVVEALLEKVPEAIDLPDLHGRAPLSWAAWRGSWSCVAVLLNKNFPVQIDRLDIFGRTAFSWAAWHSHLRILKFLVSRSHGN